jgi:SNF2 family DNA or RNA helicase
MTLQLKGRIDRRGQKQPTFIYQFMAINTVEVVLIANGLGKRQLLEDFIKVDRNKSKCP